MTLDLSYTKTRWKKFINHLTVKSLIILNQTSQLLAKASYDIPEPGGFLYTLQWGPSGPSPLAKGTVGALDKKKPQIGIENTLIKHT